jgi:hypothetical protein
VDGDIETEGRVEVCVNNAWAPICGSNGRWRSIEARVVCRQAGYLDQGAVVISTFDSGNGTAYDISCMGNENTISDCQISPSQSCVTSNVGVRCQPCESGYNYVPVNICEVNSVIQ